MNLPERIGVRAGRMPSLTSIRFFAVFHIFLYHVWNMYSLEKAPKYQDLFAEIGELPTFVQAFLSNGWMSTSFFFLLSGFLMSYLYWHPDGGFTSTKKRFWLARFARIYPAHIVSLLTVVVLLGAVLWQEQNHFRLIGSAIATALLVQSWYPPWVPIWNWPTWTISTLAFLYLCTPFLVEVLSSVSRRKLKIALFLLPVLSVVPTFVYVHFFPVGVKAPQNWQVLISNFPVLWLGQYVCGMILARVFGFSRANGPVSSINSSGISLGDLAVVGTLALACIPNIQDPFKYMLRHGFMMPIYMMIIVDLARGRGLFAKILSFRWFASLGETAFSIFIWQNLVMILAWRAVYWNSIFSGYLVLISSVSLLALAFLSTYFFEKPVASKLKNKFIL